MTALHGIEGMYRLQCIAVTNQLVLYLMWAAGAHAAAPILQQCHAVSVVAPLPLPQLPQNTTPTATADCVLCSPAQDGVHGWPQTRGAPCWHWCHPPCAGPAEGTSQTTLVPSSSIFPSAGWPPGTSITATQVTRSAAPGLADHSGQALAGGGTHGT